MLRIATGKLFFPNPRHNKSSLPALVSLRAQITQSGGDSVHFGSATPDSPLEVQLHDLYRRKKDYLGVIRLLEGNNSELARGYRSSSHTVLAVNYLWSGDVEESVYHLEQGLADDLDDISKENVSAVSKFMAGMIPASSLCSYADTVLQTKAKLTEEQSNRVRLLVDKALLLLNGTRNDEGVQISAEAPLYEAGLLEQRYKLLGALLVFNPTDREAIETDMDQTLLKIEKHHERWPRYPDELD